MSEPRHVKIARKRRYELLRYVEAFISANRYSPSTRELAREFGTSTSVINYRLDRLVKEGKLQRVPMIARGILLVEEDEQ